MIDDLGYLATFVIPLLARATGLPFLWSGYIKATEPGPFLAHVTRLRLIPAPLLRATVVCIAAFEVSLGMALLLRVAVPYSYIGTAAFLLVLSVITIWGVRSGKTTDCGCYGGYVQPSVPQSLTANTVFGAITLLAWQASASRPPETFKLWQSALVVLFGAASGVLSAAALRHERRHGEPLFDRNPLKIGNKFNPSWARLDKKYLEQDIIVCFLGTECPHCSRWVRFLNFMSKSPAFPSVVGVLAAPRSTIQSYVEDNSINFPVRGVASSLMARLAPAIPTTVFVKNGLVNDIWLGGAPTQLFPKLRSLFPEPLNSNTADHVKSTST